MSRIQVLHVVRPAGGGIMTHLLALVKGTDPERFNHLVACPPGSLADTLAAADVPTLTIPLHGELSPAADLAAFKTLVRLLKAHRINILHAHGSKAGLISRPAAVAAGVPAVVMTMHNSIFYSGRNCWISRLAAAAEGFLSRYTGGIITVSEALRREMIGRAKVSPDKVVTIYNGIQPERYRKAPDRNYLRAVAGIPPDKKVVGTVCRLAPQKGVGFFLKAAAELTSRHEETVFLVVGGGPMREQLEREAARLNLRGKVFFTGERQDVNRIMPCLDIFVLSSVTEGFPLTVLEAMASGCPLVASRTGGIPEIVDDGVNGLLVNPGDVSGLAGAVSGLLADPEKCRKLAGEARRRVEQNFTEKEMAAQTGALYQALYAGSRGCVNRGGVSAERPVW